MTNQTFPCLAFSFSVFLALVSFHAGVIHGEEREPLQYEAFRKLMGEADVTEAKAQIFIEALEQMEEAGDLSALKPFLDSEHEHMAMVAGCAFAVFEPKQTRNTLHRILQNDEAVAGRARLITGSLVATRITVDLLLARWNDDVDEDINFALSVATGESHNSQKDWQDWWKTERETFKPRRVRNFDEAFARVQQSGLAKVMSLVKKTGDDEDALKPLENAFSMLGDLQKLGEEKEHKLAAKGDRLYRSGKIDRAYESYSAALKKNDADAKSRYLLGCIDFERGHYEKAAQRFATVGSLDGADTAVFLEKLSERRKNNRRKEFPALCFT